MTARARGYAAAVRMPLLEIFAPPCTLGTPSRPPGAVAAAGAGDRARFIRGMGVAPAWANTAARPTRPTLTTMQTSSTRTAMPTRARARATTTGTRTRSCPCAAPRRRAPFFLLYDSRPRRTGILPAGSCPIRRRTCLPPGSARGDPGASRRAAPRRVHSGARARLRRRRRQHACAARQCGGHGLKGAGGRQN